MAVDLDNLLTRQIGPLPTYGWLMIAGGTGYVLYHMGFGRTLTSGGSSGSGQNTGQGTTFNSGQTTSITTTDPGTGAQTTQTNTFSSQGDGYLPGMMTYAAGPMPYSAGDVYVNYPAQQTPQPTQNATPTKDYVTTGAAPLKDGTADNNANGLATIVYGLMSNDSKDAIMGASQIVAANPQVDWAKPIPAGTTIHIPLRWIYQGFKNKDTVYNQGDTSTTSPIPSG